MSYETRRGRRYYYRARRVGNRVNKEYIGAGEAAEQAAAEVAQRKASRRRQRRLELKFAHDLALLSEEFEVFWIASQRTYELALVAHNYHCHRGQWRQRHVSR